MPPSVPLTTVSETSSTQISSAVPSKVVRQRRRMTSRKAVAMNERSQRLRNRESAVKKTNNIIDDLAQPTSEDKNAITSSPLPDTSNSLQMNSSLLSSPYGGMMGGLGGGMYGSPMMMYGGAGAGMGVGPFAGVYQVLFGVQNVIFSLTQAVQLLGTNQQALQQAMESISQMIDQGLSTFSELRSLEAEERSRLTPEQERRRKRLQALRWALVTASSYVVYKIVRRLTSKRKRIAFHQENVYNSYPSSSPYGLPYQNIGAGPPYGSASMNTNGMWGGGGGGGIGMMGGNYY